MKTVETPYAPSAIGPYCQAKISSNGLLYTAGQIALVPGTSQMVAGGIEAQTKQVLSNLEAILKEAGTSWDRVLKTTVFLTDLSDFQLFNSVYEQALGTAKPARSTVQVAALPKGASVEIELVAEV